MPAGIVTRGVILRALGENMRKSKTRRPGALAFRFLLIVAGALLLMAVLAPRANADLIAYFNFEGTPTPPWPVDFTSNPPGAVITTMTSNYTVGNTSAEAGIPLNVAPGDLEPNLTGLGLHASAVNDPANFDIPLFSPMGLFQNMTVSFAVNVAGNGFSTVTLWYSIDGGGSFINSGNFVMLPNSGALIVSLQVPAAANNAPLLVLRLQFTGGQSSGTNLQDTIDNIQINGTIVPEPTTVAGGLLGVLGLCWHQRRRLIRSVRFRRT
jgi:hypothetical protein